MATTHCTSGVYKSLRACAFHPAGLTHLALSSMAPRCYTCGSHPSRDHCPILNLSPATFISPDEPRFDPKTFQPTDVRVGHLAFGTGGRSNGEATWFWQDIAWDTLPGPFNVAAASNLPNAQLAAWIIMVRGHKVLRNDSRARLLEYLLQPGCQTRNTRKFLLALQAIYRDRQDAANEARTAAFSTDSQYDVPRSEPLQNQSHATIHPCTECVSGASRSTRLCCALTYPIRVSRPRYLSRRVPFVFQSC